MRLAFSDLWMDAVLVTTSSDSRLLPLACLLESNLGIDRMPVRLIPFDDDIVQTRQIVEIYGVELIDPDPKWDRLGQALFSDREYRPGVPSWKYFRKLNVFNGRPENVIFADSNVVLLNSLTPVLDALAEYDIVFGDRSREGRNFPPWASTLLNILDPTLRDGFNASFWATRADLFADVDIDALADRPNIRLMLAKAPEQSFLQLLAVLLRKKQGVLGEIDPGIRPTLWGDVSPPAEIAYALKHNRTRNGKTPLAIKWSGTSFHHRETIKSSQIYESMFQRILDRVARNRDVVTALEDQYRITIGNKT